MQRRTFLKSSIGASASALAGCAHGTGFQALGPAPSLAGHAQVQPFEAPFRPIRSSMDRVTRTLVGLRPFRKTGPRLEAVRVGDKDVVHNYGHGGGGVSLSWGVAEMAANLAKGFGRQRIGVLGAGAIGLSTAIALQRSGADVTIYAKDFPPYTTSNVAGAMWHPVTLYEKDRVTPETMQMLHAASRIAFRRFITYANDPGYGVYWIRQFQLRSKRAENLTPYIGHDDLYPGFVRNQPDGPFGFPYYDAFYTLMIDPDVYLRALVNDFVAAGGKMREIDLQSEAGLNAISQQTLVNCMGLGAGKVFGDEELLPARGQLTFLLPQNDIDYGYAGSVPGRGVLYSFPRKTGILLGGSVDKGDWDLEPREDEIRRMVEGHAWLASQI